MKIAIITFHCSYNYGSVLQAYALQSYLQSLGNDVKIIDYVLKSDFEQYKLLRFNYYLKKPKFILSDIFFLPKTIKRKNNFVSFINNKLNLTDRRYFEEEDLKELNKEFDAFVCGSDQIWNIDCTKEIVKPFFLSFAADDKLKIAYAPSIAQLNNDKYSECKKELSELIGRIDYLSVREKSTIPYISGLTDKPVTDVLDPTLILDKSYYYNLVSDVPERKEEYIFFYTLQKNEEMISYCQKLSDEYKLKVLYISKTDILKFKNSENIYGCSPEQFLSYIKNARFIITNSFHATVFSIVFEKKFCTFGTKKSYIRMKDLLDALGLEKRIYNPDFMIDDEIDYNEVNEKHKELIKSSHEFINNSLNKGKVNE